MDSIQFQVQVHTTNQPISTKFTPATQHFVVQPPPPLIDNLPNLHPSNALAVNQDPPFLFVVNPYHPPIAPNPPNPNYQHIYYLMKDENPESNIANLKKIDSPFVVKAISHNLDHILIDENVVSTLLEWAEVKTIKDGGHLQEWGQVLWEDLPPFVRDIGCAIMDLHVCKMNFGGGCEDVVVVRNTSILLRINEGREFCAKLTRCFTPENDEDFERRAVQDVILFNRIIIRLISMPFAKTLGAELFNNFQTHKSMLSFQLGWHNAIQLEEFVADLVDYTDFIPFIPTCAFLNHPAFFSPTHSRTYAHKLKLKFFFRKTYDSISELNSLFGSKFPNWKSYLRKRARSDQSYIPAYRCLTHALEKLYPSLVHDRRYHTQNLESFLRNNETQKTLFEDLYGVFHNAEKHLQRVGNLKTPEDVFCYMDEAIGGNMISKLHSVMMGHCGSIIQASKSLINLRTSSAPVAAVLFKQMITLKEEEKLMRWWFDELKCTKTF